jgi:HlyD family secretion protein
MRKNHILILSLLLFMLGGLAACRGFNPFSGRSQQLASQPVQRGEITAIVSATGQVRANQSANLEWRSSGIAKEINVKVGDRVSQGQVLGALDESSLPSGLILAKAERVDAQKALDELLNSQTQTAQARQALDQAEQALQDAQNPDLIRARAQQTVAQAQQAVDDAEQKLAIVKSRPSQISIEQAHSNMIMAENKLENTQRQIKRVQKRLDKNPKDYMFFESRKLYRRILKSLEIQRAQQQVKVDEATAKYNRMQEPPDPLDLAEAEANLDYARANLDAAERDYQRKKDGYSPGEIAVLEAQRDDARREWERLKDGPDPADIQAAEARLEAAEATLTMDRITAPFSGVVTEVPVQRGDQVHAGTQAFRLDDLSSLLVDVNISEIDINRIQVGQPVRLTFDAVSVAIARSGQVDSQTGQEAPLEYQGRVVEVKDYGQEIQGVTHFGVTVEITDPDQWIKPGITAEAEFVVQRLEDVLRVPNSAIRFLEGQRVVYVLRRGSAEAVKITTGASSQDYSQVLSGDLAEGDMVLTDPPADILAAR